MQTASFPQIRPASDSRRWAAAMHIGALVLALLTSWISGVAGALVAGVVYLAKRDDFAGLPEPLRTQLGSLSFVLEVALTPERKLARKATTHLPSPCRAKVRPRRPPKPMRRCGRN